VNGQPPAATGNGAAPAAQAVEVVEAVVDAKPDAAAPPKADT
jgi:hypothetical protein